MVGITRHDYDRLKRINVREASVERESSSDEVEARRLIDGSSTDDCFGTTDLQKAGDVTDTQGDAHRGSNHE